MAFNVEKYLNRINYQAGLGVDLDTNLKTSLQTLAQLQACHLYAVPFENWDIHDNVEIVLDIERIFHKVVDNKRGGFCYELNALFCQLLTELGFDARMVSAQVYSESKGAYGAPFDHMMIIVMLDGLAYLVDVGFGEFASAPMLLDTVINVSADTASTATSITEVTDKRGVFQISRRLNGQVSRHNIDTTSSDGSGNGQNSLNSQQSHGQYFIAKKENGTFAPVCKFDCHRRELAEFAQMCLYHQTSPESHFTQQRIFSLATATGRKTVSGNRFINRQQLTDNTNSTSNTNSTDIDKPQETLLTDAQATDLRYVTELVFS